MRRPGRRPGVLAMAVAVGACTMVVPAPPTAPATVPGPPSATAPGPPVPVGPPPDVERGIDLRDVRLRPLRSFEEIRGLWVVRYTMTSERAVREMVDRAAAAGINTLIVQIRGRADAFYRSDLEPRAEPVTGAEDFDPLAFAIEEAHARGIAVHAWVNTHLVWGANDLPESPLHLVNANPGWLAVPRALGKELSAVDPDDPEFVAALVRYARERSRTVEGVYSSPSHPAVKDRVHAVWVDLADRYDLDGIHFDYIRFPSSDFDYSIGALERFRIWVSPRLGEERYHRLDDASTSDIYAFADALPELWGDFRREQITGLVARIYRDVKARRPRIVISAAVVADPEIAYASRFQDWRGWLRDGILDVAVPMAYTPDSARFEELIRSARQAAGDRRRVWAGIGAYLNTAQGTIGLIDVARAEDAGGIILFSYDWAVGEGRGDPSDPFLRRIGRARFGRR